MVVLEFTQNTRVAESLLYFRLLTMYRKMRTRLDDLVEVYPNRFRKDILLDNRKVMYSPL